MDVITMNFEKFNNPCMVLIQVCTVVLSNYLRDKLNL